MNTTQDGSIDVIVIGSGAGGLSAALRLAAAGKRVHVFEALDGPGGKIGEATHEGVSFDTGPSLLTMRDQIEELFTASGARLEEELELLSPEPGFRYLWPDGARLEVHHELSRTRHSVQESFGSGALKEFDAFLTYSQRIWEAALPNFVAGEAPSFGSLMKLGMSKIGEVSRIDPFRSMMQGITRHVSEPHLREVMMRYATYNGSNVMSAPATLNCIAWVELGMGGWGVRGGMRALPLALERVGERLGVRFHYGARVERVLVERGRACGVLVGGERVAARTVVINADVGHIKGALLEGESHGLTAEEEPSMSGWTAVVRAAPREARAAHTVYFPEVYEDEFRDIFDRDSPPTSPTVYLCDQRLSHGRAGWEDGSAPVFVMGNAPCEPARGRRDPAVWGRYKERVLRRAVQGGVLGEGEACVWERDPGELAAQFPGSRGAIYGAASNSQLAAFKRPPNRLKAIGGIYLATGSAHPGGGVPLCVLSGKLAAEQALEDG